MTERDVSVLVKKLVRHLTPRNSLSSFEYSMKALGTPSDTILIHDEKHVAELIRQLGKKQGISAGDLDQLLAKFSQAPDIKQKWAVLYLLFQLSANPTTAST
eukprot:TRINITY_DN4044_c0_g1_i1.p1 TRINITY_DN4044_c0_g1~~TRINITY_DN4044_c0_g1_i1.p1  ORF type:complete len:102 (+),score=18.24 TRINITY_DN4044_c0_g1_i1:31-336(+)